MELVTLQPTDIKASNRVRTEMGDLKSLSESIKRFGNILPIVINRNQELIDGGRRLAAAALAGKEVVCVYNDTVDPLEMKELELEANLHRLDFSPAEKSRAVKELHELMQAKHGKAMPGASGGWTAEDTAKKIGFSRAKVVEELQIAQAIEDFPELEKVSKKSDIKRAVKALDKLQQTVCGIKLYEAQLEGNQSKTFQLIHADALDFLETVPNNSVNILLTDPLYGIEHDKLMIGAGGATGGASSTGYKFNDATAPALRCYDFLAQQSFRFTTPDSHAYIFLAIEHFNTVKELFQQAGWLAYVKPLIWIKRTTGACNAPQCWPSDCYEAILYCRKEQSSIVKEGMPNWIECPPVLVSEKIHQYEKPVKLLDNLIQRSALPGQVLLDPFMGSGSSIEAGVARKLFCTGVDSSQEAYAFASKRMVEYLEKEKLK